MKKFKFKLEKILSIREKEEEHAKIEYAEVLQKKIGYQNEIETLNIEKAHYESAFFENGSAGTKIDYNLFKSVDNYNRGVECRINDNLTAINNLEDELKRRESILKEAMKKRKLLEKLKEKEFNKWDIERETEETDLLDEMSANMYIFGRRENDRRDK